MTNPDETLPVEQVRAWPLNGYAPGNYSCRCGNCQCQFYGDKRAIHCLECAVIMAKSAAQSPPPVSEALRCAVGHIEHMAAWISKMQVGTPPVGTYSFEGLGEDMPSIKAALSSPSPGCDAETIEARLDADKAERELSRLYNYTCDDSRQFTRWQMIVAMQHGYRIAAAIRNLGKEQG